MPTPLFRYSHKGAARKAVLTVALGGTTGDTTITCDDLTGWPTGASSRPFVAVIGRGTATEEKILCASRSGNVITVQTTTLNGRAFDDTTITSHSVNDIIEHVWTSTEGEDSAAHIAAASGVHGVIGSVVGTSDTQTLSGKTLTSPTITTPAITGGTISGVSMASPTFTGNPVAPTAAASNNSTQIATTAYAQTQASISPINTQASSYSVVAADAGKTVEINSASAVSLNLVLDATVNFPIGTIINVMQTGAGQVSIAAGGTTLNATPGLKLRTQYSVASVQKRAANSWIAFGDLTA